MVPWGCARTASTRVWWTEVGRRYGCLPDADGVDVRSRVRRRRAPVAVIADTPIVSGVLLHACPEGDGWNLAPRRATRRGGQDGHGELRKHNRQTSSFCQEEELSNGFSRKIENHLAAVAINYFAYNFITIHTTLRTSPAMAAGV